MIEEPLKRRHGAVAAAGETLEKLTVIDDDRSQPREAPFVFTSPELGKADEAIDQGHAPYVRAIALECQRAIARYPISSQLRDNARMKIDPRQVAERASELAKQRRITDREASIDASGKPDMIRDMRRGRMPGGDRLEALATTLGTTVEFLLGKTSNSGVDLPMDRMPRDVPVYGTALGADLAVDDGQHVVHVERTILELTEAIDRVRRPPGIAGDTEAYSLFVVGTSMVPRYDDGDPIYVSIKRPPALGDYVVVQVANDNGNGEIISALVKKLVGRTAGAFELEQFNPPLRFKIDRSRVARIHRIIPPRELYGN